MICRVTKDSSGVGLIEILAAMSVILILSALVLPRIRRFLEFYALDSAIQTLSSNLEVARYSAISRRCNAVAQFNASASSYEVFEDKNGNGAKDSAERTFGSYSLPRRVLFSGANLKGPPANPSGSVSDPISFSGDRLAFNPTGKINGGLGTIYLQNSTGDAFALTFNMASRLKIYRWSKAAQTWK